MLSTEYKRIKYDRDTSNTERENKTLNVKPGPMRQIKERRRIPVLRNKERFGKAKKRSPQTDLEHLFSAFQAFLCRIAPSDRFHADTLCVANRVACKLGVGNEPRFVEFLCVGWIFLPGFFNILKSGLDVQSNFYI